MADESSTPCACGNHARYVDEDGYLTCALCPLRAGKDSIRIADVPRLLKWARAAVDLRSEGLSDLRGIIGRRPSWRP
jgi:hypothetical protein